MNYNALADFLFPNVTEIPQNLENRYPARSLPEGAKVTRMAPSPTGFMHLGNLYGAIADERLAHQSSGVFYLRIEDTDQKREVAGGVETILQVFSLYELPFDEGATAGGDNGAYGPYRQRQRAALYHVCAKWLVQQGLAYPCFLTEQELADIREEQAEKKLNFGCYGEFARYRNAEMEEIQKRIAGGQGYVIRLRSPGNPENRIKVTDLVRGLLELPENDQDVVLLKADGIPTYHFAHVVDDHLMRTTHVVRGEEWLATLPIHVQLFACMGWKAPKYLHTAQLMKMDGGSKRKLSKRKDPELALDFYSEKGYTVAAVKEYLLSLLNSNFEEWRLANPEKDLNDFPFSIKKMGTSGALFDIDKLDDISRNVISRMEASQVYSLVAAWALRYDAEFAALFTRDAAYTTAALNIGRNTPKRRKDITVWSEVKEYIGFFFDELFQRQGEYPANVPAALAAQILTRYAEVYSPADDNARWFERVKQIADEVGFAGNMKDFKQNPEAYGGNVGDVSMVLRLAVTGRAQSPDLCEVMQVMGQAKVQQRLRQAAATL
ncbi:MAG: glutamate--tRNA ligase [Oscillospiraceae bacterium]